MINSYFNKNTLKDIIDEMQYVYLSDKRTWIIGYSGGKDSTVVVNLVYAMLIRLEPEKRHKPVYIVSSDTMVENPLIKIYLYEMIDSLRLAARRDDLPLECQIVHPEPSNTFWANVIGRGFPTPKMNGTFRWCTDRLKISPSEVFIKEIMSRHKEEAVILLGVRKDESIVRKVRMENREIEGRLLIRHDTTKGAWVYSPISEFTTDDVWKILLSNNSMTSWGVSTNRIVELYTGADSGECPFAGISTQNEQNQSCGKSRFGCWICTVVKEDKSLNGFIRSGHRELIPLAELRKWLMSIRDIPEYRDKKRRDGKVYLTPTGEPGLGPFSWEARQEILKRLLKTQKEINYELITEDELKAIDRIWDEELDLTRQVLVNLYFQETGNKLPWHDIKYPLFEKETINDLIKNSEQLDLPFDLIKNLIFATTKNKYYSNPKIIRTALEKSMVQQWLHVDIMKEFENEN